MEITWMDLFWDDVTAADDEWLLTDSPPELWLSPSENPKSAIVLAKFTVWGDDEY